MMKRIVMLAWVLVGMLVSSVAEAQQAKSLLWKVSGNGLKETSYVFGTIHLICKNDFVWTEPMGASLKASNKLCLEMDLDDPALLLSASQAMMDMSGKKLSSYFSAAEYELLKKYMKDSVGMDVRMAELMKPVGLQMMLTTKKAVVCDSSTSYEEYLMKLAKAGSKEVLGLETIQDQLAALDVIPIDSVVKGIMDVVTGRGQSELDFDDMIAAYKQQDIEKLHTLIEGKDGIGAASKELVDDRNKKWMERMSAYMKEGSVFFAVGAGHLAGANGVLALLMARGYRVVPVQ